MKIQNCYHAITSPSLRKIIKEMEPPPLPQCGSAVVRSKASYKLWMTLLSSDPLSYPSKASSGAQNSSRSWGVVLQEEGRRITAGHHLRLHLIRNKGRIEPSDCFRMSCSFCLKRPKKEKKGKRGGRQPAFCCPWAAGCWTWWPAGIKGDIWPVMESWRGSIWYPVLRFPFCIIILSVGIF